LFILLFVVALVFCWFPVICYLIFRHPLHYHFNTYGDGFISVNKVKSSKTASISESQQVALEIAQQEKLAGILRCALNALVRSESARRIGPFLGQCARIRCFSTNRHILGFGVSTRR
jgi:hypothetical protein